MALIRRDFKRKSGFRDAKLIVIATEGERTEPRYFEGVRARYHRPSVQVEILKRSTEGSSPRHVQRELDQFRRDYNLIEGDELWMVVDRDRWTDNHLADVARQCDQKGYFLAVSVPCFELWLLLHIEDPDRETIQGVTCKGLVQRIRRLLGSYNKTNPEVERFIDGIEDAIARARNRDDNPADRWPQSAGTRVYLLAEKIVQ